MHDSPSLYKFLNNSSPYFKETIQHLADQQLRFSSRKELNDPWEALHPVDPAVTRMWEQAAIESGLQSYQVENMRQAPVRIVDRLRDSGIYCASVRKPDRDPLQNMLLWSHYANAGKGGCVEIDPIAFLSPPGSDNGIFLGQEVHYVSEHERADIGFEPIHEFMFPSDGKLNNDLLVLALYQKHKCWDYECEYRFLSKEPGYVTLARNPVKAIYFGPHTLPEEAITIRASLRDCCNDQFFRASINGYGLTFEPEFQYV